MSIRPDTMAFRAEGQYLMLYLNGSSPLTDVQRESLRKTGRSIYGKPPYCITDEEKKRWEEARVSRKETH